MPVGLRLRRATFLVAAVLLVIIAASGASPPNAVEEAAPPEPGELEVRALAAAWPGRVSETDTRGGEWALLMDGVWYLWAEGRLMPEAERDRWQQYGAYRFYRYPLDLPQLAPLDAEGEARVRSSAKEARKAPSRREAFLEELLGAGSAKEAWSHIVPVSFLGHTAKVHELVAGPLTDVAREVALLAQRDPEVAAFLANLKAVQGYNWRSVSGRQSRSYHAYGLAVDLIPVKYRGHPYWQWAAERVDRWWEIPYERRWMIPLPIVQAFERNGFVWGGKWLFFDTMHFEYRPEILLLARQREGGAPSHVPAERAGDEG